MPQFRNFRRLVSLLLVLGLISAPLAPTFAAVSDVASTMSAHIHHGAGGDNPSADALAPDRAGCAQHDQCQGSCCSACAHCVLAMAPWSSTHLLVRAGHHALIASLFSDPPVTALPRPPQSLR